MIALANDTRVWLAAGMTDMRKGFDGLSALVATTLEADPFSGHVFVFRGKRGDRIKLLWYAGEGLCLFAKRLERGRFVWPQAQSGKIHLSIAQLSMLLEGIDWRSPERTWRPQHIVTFTVTRRKNVAQNDLNPLRNLLRVGKVSLCIRAPYPTMLKR